MKPIFRTFGLAVTLFSEQQVLASQSLPDQSALITEIVQVKYASSRDIAALLGETPTWSNNPSIAALKDFRSDINLLQIENEIRRLGSRRVTSDERNNALLISASPADFAKLKDVIAKLDVPLRQVLVEAVVFALPVSDPANARLGAFPVSTHFLEWIFNLGPASVLNRRQSQAPPANQASRMWPP